MGFAFLFDPSTVEGHYGDWARDVLFRSRILQRSNECMKVRIGDLLYDQVPPDKIPPREIEYRLTSGNLCPGLLKRALDSALWKHCIYVIAVDGISAATALQLHAWLYTQEPYMGCYGFNLSGLQWYLFEFCLILRYRIVGDECWTDYDEEVLELQQLGCFANIRHVPVFDTDFVIPETEPTAYCSYEAVRLKLLGR
jgi:hypothetical protein